MGRRVGLVVLAAAIAFAVVQDRGTSAGVGRYIAAQRAALAGRAPRVTVDEVMGPANRAATRRGLEWAGVVGLTGLVISWRFRRG